jgi:putative DNA-invertase from lambdoid prophage Rac
LVVRWVDRLGRNYEDVTDAVREFIRRGIRIETVINRMTFDGTTTDPMQQAIRDSLLAFMAAMAQSQAEVIKEAQKAGNRTRAGTRRWHGISGKKANIHVSAVRSRA